MVLLVSALAGEVEGFSPLITGVGKINAAMTLARYLSTQNKPPAIINLGSAGGVGLPKGSLVLVEAFHQWDMRCEGLDFRRGQTPLDQFPSIIAPTHEVDLPGLKAAHCYTSDQFLDDPALLPPGPCVVEMEAFALAKVCAAFDVPFAAIKFVTDAADGEAGEDWQAGLPNCAESLSQIAEQLHA